MMADLGVRPDLTAVAEAVCRMPIDDEETGLSHLSLLERTGYLKVRSHFNAGLLRKVLRRRPELFQRWMRWSQEVRGTPAWFMREISDGVVEVGYLERGGGISRTSMFRDQLDGCAEFIYMEIEQLADLWNRRVGS